MKLSSKWKSLALAMGVAFAPAVASALPNELMQEGVLLDAAGNPLQGAHTIRVRIWNDLAAGAAVHDETFMNVQLVEGYYFIAVGSTRPLLGSLFTGNAFLGLTIDGGAELAPRLALRKVPAAFISDNAVGDITPRTVSVGGNLVIDANGRWVGNVAGLQGPAGPAGPQGPVGPVGPAGGAGQNADPAAVVPLLVQNLQANPNQLPYVRSDVAATKQGNLTLASGSLSASGTVSATGNVSSAANVVGGVEVQAPIGRFTTIFATNLTSTNATIQNMNGNVIFSGNLTLNGDVILGPNTDFIGTLRSGDIIAANLTAANITTPGNLNVANVNATGTVTASGDVRANGAVRAGAGGMFVNNVQVFDGNGNLLRRPQYTCPDGSLLFGTDAAGNPRCVNVTCPAGQSFRGFDAALNPVCEVDDTGLAAVPANQCPAGQAVVQIAPNGQTTCGVPSTQRDCPAGQYVSGIAANGTLTCGTPAGGGAGGERPLRGNLMVCGATGRPANQFIPAGVNLNVIAGCAPDANTQAMLVTRNGVGNRNAAWKTWVEAGGIIVTEYSTAHLVFSTVFNVNQAQGGNNGGCSDDLNPPTRFNLNDAFWVANQANPTQANTGCGYDVTNFPGITRLAGWNANTTQVAYRDAALGRLWLVESDWQDNEASMGQASKTFMGYMITHGARVAGGGGGAAPALFQFQGVRNNVADADLLGWNRCMNGRYNDNQPTTAAILANCSGPKIMYGCRSVGSPTWRVLAQGDRAAVFTDVGQNGGATTQNNGVGWYFSGNWSVGFAPGGQAVTRNSCDTTNQGSDDRICWHSGGNTLNNGWRCGNQIVGDANWERAIWHGDPAAGGGGGGGGNVWRAVGPQENIPDATLVGWTRCYTGRYNENAPTVAAVQAACNQGNSIMYGCRPAGAANWTLLGQGARAQVFQNTGDGGNALVNSNGIDWYFSSGWSIGFVAQGTGVSRNSCDTAGNVPQHRMCWHTGGGNMNSGYRCGNNFLNGNNGWERAIWTAP
jgi:hypothetical protein